MTSNRGSRREIFQYARYLLVPVLGLLACVIWPVGWVVGLVRPSWGYAVWDSLEFIAGWID